MKSPEQKEQLTAELKRVPVIELACKKIGIGRTTYYRWLKEDSEFAKKAIEAFSEGLGLMNDVVESQLLSAIKAGNLTAIIFWLKNRHPDYKQKMFQSALTVAEDENNNIYFELFGHIKPETERLIEPYFETDSDHGQKQS